MNPSFAPVLFAKTLLGFLEARFKTPTGRSMGWTVDFCFYVPDPKP
jgi:hypothetical protein